ncbi:MAG TPA: PqqD family protein [Gemmatimonadaceae bacterium]|nr:PqqD family protein [Gemmatimonadaceae bacterium]
MLPVPKDDVIFRRLDDGAVVYHCSEEVYFGLNAGGARVWELLPPVSASLDEIVERIAGENPGTDAATIRRDAEAVIASFERFGLVRAA